MNDPNRGKTYLRWRASFGDASLAALLAQLGTATATEIERAHRARHAPEKLEAERREDARRAAAAQCDRELVRYEQHWAKRLRALQRAHPVRWHVPGWSPEEVVDALTLHLIEGVRGDPASDAEGRPGREWGLLRAEARVRALRRTCRLEASPCDLRTAVLPAREEDPETAWLDAESERCRAIARRAAEEALAPSQRSWLGALRATVTDGDVFCASGKPNLSAASRRLGMNRSSALRAYRELRETFSAALRRVE